MRVGDLSSELETARFHSFAKKMPAYYFSVIAMMFAVIFVFHAVAPVWLACGVPGLTIAVSTWRGLWWVKHRYRKTSSEEARHHLARATKTLIAAALIVVAMDVALFQHGDREARYFLLFQMLASTMCGFYSLMHLRTAALSMAAAVIIPVFFLMLSMRSVSITIAAATCVITCIVMLLTMLGYQQDFTTLVKSKAESLRLGEDNLRLANMDMLTGLPNRRHFFKTLETIRQDCHRYHGSIVMGLIDLDGFKAVNDTHGHRVGDLLLTEISLRFGAVSPIVQHLCRIGGDEFAFLLIDIEDDDKLTELGMAMVHTASLPAHIEGRVTSVGCSIGFARSAPWEIDADLLYEHADYALYHAKSSGRARSVIFSEEHATLLREQGLVEQTLRHANLELEFYPLFQPIVDTRTQRTQAFECLARWQSPALGHVSPGIFIPVAEHTGIITQLTPILLRKALAIAQFWPPFVRLSFNVSPYDIASMENTLNLISIIQESGFDPHRVSIELTETALLQSFASTRAHMERIRETGTRISLDDFGCGHSSLSYLHSLPLDTIKVDQSFVRHITTDNASKNIVRSLIHLCRDMGLACVVEGVETIEQLTFLESFGAEAIQGYFFAKPMPAEDIFDYLSKPSPTLKSKTYAI